MSQEADLPMLPGANTLEIAPLLRLSREEIYHSIQSTSSQASDKSAYDSDKLLISTIDISKSSMCSMSDISCHLLRVVSHLWKIIISGVGEPNLAWANPAAIIPLRIQAFATLLQLLGSSTIYLSKRGVTQLDGGHKWNLVALSRVMALLFDEGALYGNQAEEPFAKEFFGSPEKPTPAEAPTTRPRNKKDKRRRHHVRSTFEFVSNGDGLGMADGSENLHGNGVAEASLAADENPRHDGNPSAGGMHTSETKSGMSSLWGDADDDVVFVDDFQTGAHGSQPEMSQDGLNIDSVTDFRRALEMGTREVGDYDSAYEGPTNSGEKVAMAMIKAYSGPSAGVTGWKTAPTPGLATIKEDGDGDEPEPALSALGMFQPKNPKGPLDYLDAEQEYVNHSKGSVKQMRVPKRITDDVGSTDDNSPLRVKIEDKSGTERLFTSSVGSTDPFRLSDQGEARGDSKLDQAFPSM
jgi:hypothetical protein